MERHRVALRTATVTMIINILLMCGKLTVGVLSHSEAMISDGLHSAADVVSTLAVMIGIKLSARRCDRRHPYGHERMECVAAVLLAVVIGATGLGIGFSGVQSIVTPDSSETMARGGLAFWMAVAAIVIKEVLFRWMRRAAVKSGSSALLADAWHQRTDALSSVGSLVGIVGAMSGVAVMDSIAAVAISLLILKAAVSIFVDAMRKMTDRSCSEELQEAIGVTVASVGGVLAVEELKTRLFGNRVLAEVTVSIVGEASSKEAYAIAQEIRQTVENAHTEVKECAVHIHPL